MQNAPPTHGRQSFGSCISGLWFKGESNLATGTGVDGGSAKPGRRHDRNRRSRAGAFKLGRYARHLRKRKCSGYS